MKKIFFLTLFTIAITSCDDGNLTVQSIDFSTVTAVKCSVNNVVYKLKENEALLLEVPAASFENEITAENTPRVVTIDGTNKLVYRSYNGTVAAGNVCGSILNVTPASVEEWTTTSGTIEITTTANVVANTALITAGSANATKIANYNHSIVLKNFVWNKPNGNQNETNYSFGNYTTAATNLAFGFDQTVEKSSCDNRIFNFSGSEVLILDCITNYSTLFQNSVTTTPRTALINADNKLTYILYTAGVADANLCGTAALPTVNQTWTANDGIIATSGIIEVTTTVNGVGFEHAIHLKKVTFKKGTSTFTTGDDYFYGSFLTN